MWGKLQFARALSLALAGLVSGVWTGQLPGRNNTFTDIAFRFEQSGDTVTGKLYGDYASYKIIEGRLDGGKIDFVVVSSEQRGNEINDARFRYTGTIKDDEMELTRERLSVVKAGSGEAVTVRNDTKPVIKLKRLTTTGK